MAVLRGIHPYLCTPILPHDQHKKSCRKSCSFVSDHHSIANRFAIADFGLFDRYPIALRGFTQTLTTITTLGCANLCSTSPPPPRQKTPDRANRVCVIPIAIASSIARSGALSPTLCNYVRRRGHDSGGRSWVHFWCGLLPTPSRQHLLQAAVFSDSVKFTWEGCGWQWHSR